MGSPSDSVFNKRKNNNKYINVMHSDGDMVRQLGDISWLSFPTIWGDINGQHQVLFVQDEGINLKFEHDA